MKDTLRKRNIHIQDDENIILVVRKHWFNHVLDTLSALLIGILPFIVFAFISPFIGLGEGFAGLIAAIWLLVLWMTVFTIWTNYYLDIWIVTNKRIINIDQIHLFKRDISTLRVERVQDIKVETHGFFATMLNFGNLQVQTAGPEAGFYFIQGIPNPSKVRNAVLERVDMVTEHKSSFDYNRDQRPTDAE